MRPTQAAMQTGLHRQAVGLLVAALDAREASDALFARARCAAIECLFVGTRLHAFPVTATTLLVHEDNPILGPLEDSVARAGCQAGWISAVIAQPGQIEEPGLVLGTEFTAFKGKLAFRAFFVRRWIILETIRRGPFVIGGQIAENPIGAFVADVSFRSFEHRLAFEVAEGRFEVLRSSVPGLPAGVRLLEQVERLYIPMMRVAVFHVPAELPVEDGVHGRIG